MVTTVVVIVLALAVIALTGWLLRRRRAVPQGPVPRPVAYTPHARERMAQRGVQPAQVMSVIARPDRNVLTDYADLGAWGGAIRRDSVRLERDIEGRTLKVWVPAPWPPPGEVVVKSVAWSDYFDTVRVPAASIGRVIGRAGATIEAIERRTGATISHTRGGEFRISADDVRSIERAKRAILQTARSGNGSH